MSDGPPPHAIRLRGPWELSPLAGGVPQRVTLPDGLPATSADGCRLTRRFGRPTGLEPTDRVWLEVVAATSVLVLLNGERLTPVPGIPPRYDMTARLADRNRLELLMEPNDGPPTVAARLLIEPES